jgi:hypothetical protein
VEVTADITTQIVDLAGDVDVLRGGAGKDGRCEGEVGLTLHWQGERIEVWAFLTADQYALAVRAHMSCRPLIMRGRFERQLRRWVIEQLSLSNACNPPRVEDS